ncbi:MAG: SRPBCC domain-containing protein [Pseudomonadota bacterium]
MSSAIHQEVVFEASPAKVYEALMNADQHAAFTKGKAEISRDVGGEFTCHDGQIVGRNIELVPNERIVQAWRVANWEAGVYSVVRFELMPEGDKTRLILDHAGVDDDKSEMVAAGWKVRYWEPMQSFLA